MSLQEEILSLLSSEGYPTNEVILDALSDFVSVVEDEMESHDSRRRPRRRRVKVHLACITALARHSFTLVNYVPGCLVLQAN